MRGSCRLILLLNLILAVVACASADEHGALGCASDHRWARIVRDIADGQEVACRQEGDTIIYVVSSPTDASRSAGIALARQGRLLDKARYDRAYAAAGETERLRDFPKDGARSMVEQVFAGPGGSVSSIVSTTSDERHDVKVTVADRGSTRPRPDTHVFDVHALNRRLHQAYDAVAAGRVRR